MKRSFLVPIAAIVLLIALVQAVFGGSDEPLPSGWARMGALKPHAWYVPFQSDVPVGSLHFLIQADEDGVANLIMPTTPGYQIGVQLVATAAPTPVPPTPTYTPSPTPTRTKTPVPTATFTASPTPTRPNALAPGSWTDLFTRVQALWAAQKAWDEQYGGGN